MGRKWTAEDTKRLKHFNETGEWLPTEKQIAKRAAERKANEAAVEEPTEGATEQAHAAVSPQMANAPKVEAEEPKAETHEQKVARLWWAAHPHLR
jgi:hypothetical protein